MKSEPSTNGSNGDGSEMSFAVEPSQRDSGGRFKPGNKFGKGNPYANQIASLRNCFFNAVSSNELEEIIHALLKKAKSGDVAAIKLLLSYTVGNPEIVVRSAAETTEPETIRVVFV